jgi:hypothetical protein
VDKPVKSIAMHFPGIIPAEGISLPLQEKVYDATNVKQITFERLTPEGVVSHFPSSYLL